MKEITVIGNTRLLNYDDSTNEKQRVEIMTGGREEMKLLREEAYGKREQRLRVTYAHQIREKEEEEWKQCDIMKNDAKKEETRREKLLLYNG